MAEQFLRKFFSTLLILTLSAVSLISWQGLIFAVQQNKAEAKATKPSIVAFEKRQAMLNQMRKINNTAWQVRFTRISEEKKKESYNDELSFVDNKFASKKMLREGFSPTSFTLRLKGENLVIWETMQTRPNNDLALWKGEIEGERMHGVLSRHFNNKTVKDYNFVSTKKEAISAVKEESKNREPEKKPEQKPKQKKRGWFW